MPSPGSLLSASSADRRARARARRAATIGVVTAAVVMGQATGALAAPASAPTVSQVVSQTLQPVLAASAPAAGSGQSIKFYARTIGSSTWNLLDGTSVPGASGTAQIPAGKLAIQSNFEFRADNCDASGCTASAVRTGQVSAGPGLGARPGQTTVSFSFGDQINARVDVGSGNLMISVPQFTLPRVAGDLTVGAVYNSTSRWYNNDFPSSLADGWRLSTGSDVRLVRDYDDPTGSVTFFGPNGLTGVFWPVAGTNTFTPPAGFKMDLTSNANGWALYDHGTGDVQDFNTRGQLTTLTDRNGNKTTFTYNGVALTGIVGDQGPADARKLTVTTAGNGSRQITKMSQTPQYGSSERPRSVTYGYNDAGKLTSITDTAGRTTTLAYGGASGNLNTITAPGGVVTDLTYDNLGRVKSITQPTATDRAGAVTRLVYTDTTTFLADANSDRSKTADIAAHTTYEHTTDGMKLIAKAIDPTGNARAASYTSFLDVASASNSAGSTSFGYDASVNGGESLTGVTGASGATSSFSYGNSGPAQFQPSSATDGQGNASTYTYSGAGNRLSAANADGVQASVTYNGDGTVATSTSPSGAVTTFSYDGNKQLTGITPPADSTLQGRTYTYDGFGRMRTYTSGRGITETYTYDALDRITTTATSNGGGTVTYDYDAAGRLTSRVDPSGTTTMGYDPLGRLASRKHSINNLTISYTYDKAGNLATVTDPGGTTRYAYDSRNLVTRMTLPGGELIDFGYDADGRRVDTWQGTNTAHTTWDAHTRTAYDAAGRVTRVYTARASNDADRASDFSYRYASNGTACSSGLPEGTETSLRQSMTDHTTGLTTTYCYDTANRLTSASTPGGDSFTYAYDVNGNRTQQTKNGAVVDTQTVNAADQLTNTGYAHDASGNLTASPELGKVTYSATEQMTQRTKAATPATYTYAGTNQNELITMAKDGDTRTLTYGRTDANGLPLIEAYNAEGGTSYIAHDPNGTPVAIRAFTGQTHYYAEDGLGSTTALINQDGNVTGLYDYDPSGEVTIAASPNTGVVRVNPFRYAGGTYDYTSNLIKFGQRWYDPTTGRFTQQDSLETLADPTRANRYEYAAGNPINYVDPTGLAWSWRGAVIGAVTGFLGGAVCGGLTFGITKNPVAGFKAGVACGTVVSAFVGGATS